jgi:hypothetical protein
MGAQTGAEFHLAWKQPDVFLVDCDRLRMAQRSIASCEACAPETAATLFDDVLDGLTGCDPTSTDYQLACSVRCPRCMREIESGAWRWFTSGQDRRLFICPATLVALKDGVD